MSLKDLNLPEPWVGYLKQIEIATQGFWQQPLNRNYIRIQKPRVWLALRRRLIEISTIPGAVPLSDFETFLLHAAAHLYELGWQAPNAHQLSLVERYAESGRLIRGSVSRNFHRSADLGLSGLDSITVEILAKICETVGWDDLTPLSIEPQPAGYQETARLRYLVALLQLADQLLIDRANETFIHHIHKLDNLTDARLALGCYVSLIKFQENGLTVHYSLHPKDEDLTKKITALFEEPILKWLAANLGWLTQKEFNYFLQLNEPEVTRGGLQLEPIGVKCEALRGFLDEFEPPAIEIDYSKFRPSPKQETPDEPFPDKLRLDAAVPSEVYLERTFDLAVAVRQPSSPLLTEEDLTNVQSGEVQLSWPESKPDVSLRLELSAPECEIHDSNSDSFYLDAQQESPVFHFHLTPKKLGEISIIVKVYQKTDWLGSALVHTVAREQVTDSVKLDITSHKIEERYVDFELHIDPNGHAIARSNEGQATAKVSTHLSSNMRLSKRIIEKNEADEELLKDFGQELYNWLFPPPIHAHLQQTEAVAKAVTNAKLRLRLNIEAESLARLPLEFAYRVLGEYFLASNPKTVLSRYLNLSLPPNRVRRREGPLHLLIIIANPSDQTPLIPDEWERLILQALAAPINAGQITTQTVKLATFNQIRNALHRKPDIIQFVGHGIYRAGKSYLALVDDNSGQTWEVDDERFANILLGFDDHLGLVSLTMCQNAKSDSSQGFVGIAPQIVRRGVPAVVAMQYKLPIEMAKIFLENFYTSIAARKPVDWAVQWARNAISIKPEPDKRDFAAPVLYMRAEDGQIF